MSLGILLSLLLQGGCAAPNSPQGEEGGLPAGMEALFPHPDDWPDAASHGPRAIQFETDVCLYCHPLEASNDRSTPACYSCHSLYPHTENWSAKENHGAAVLGNGGTADAAALTNGGSNCATQCHGTDLQGGLSGVSCSRCHANYPHGSDWADPERHGTFAKGDGKSSCRNCHGDDLRGGESGVSCYQCHSDFPHPDGWGDPEGHGGVVTSDGQVNCATACHGTDLQGGSSGVSCTSCHTLYPHGSDWASPGQHGEAAKGDGKALCRGCHGEDLTGGGSGVSCTQCHSLYPHTSDWEDPEEHGALVLSEGDGGCTTQCHGADLQGGLSGVSCNTCHTLYPHTDQWEQDHGAVTLQIGKTVCQNCHGTNYDQMLDGKNCYSCHVSYPHLAGWLMPPGNPQGHGDFVTAQSSASCATEMCHGTDLVPTPDVTQGPACSNCHGGVYPHTGDWDSGAVHGISALEGIAACKACHGDGLNEAPAGFQSCEQCHPSYLLHTSAGAPAGWNSSSQGHKKYLEENGDDISQCQICHGADYTGGLSGKTCQTCHEDFPPFKPMTEFNCMTCHFAHGEIMPTNDICLTCHPDVTMPHEEMEEDEVCYDCHDMDG